VNTTSSPARSRRGPRHCFLYWRRTECRVYPCPFQTGVCSLRPECAAAGAQVAAYRRCSSEPSAQLTQWIQGGGTTVRPMASSTTLHSHLPSRERRLPRGSGNGHHSVVHVDVQISGHSMLGSRPRQHRQRGFGSDLPRHHRSAYNARNMADRGSPRRGRRIGGRGVRVNAVCPGWIKREMDVADHAGGPSPTQTSDRVPRRASARRRVAERLRSVGS